MADFLYIVGACREAGNGNLTTGIGGIGTGYQRGAGAVAVNAELPSGQVLAILRSLGQTQVAQIRRIESEVGIDIAGGCAVKADTGLVRRTGHIPDVIGGICGRGYILGCLEDSRLGNGSGLIDVQIVAALVELCTIAICKTPTGENTVAVIDRGFISGEGDVRCIGTGTASKAGAFHCALNIGHQGVVVGRKVGNSRYTGIIEDIACSSTLVGRVKGEGGGVSQTTDDLIDQELGSHAEGDVGVRVSFDTEDAIGIIPHLITVQQDQTDSFPSLYRQRVPDITAGRTVAAIKGDIPVNRVAGCTGTVIAPWLNTVDGIVCIGCVVIPGEVPAQIFDVGSSCGAAAVGFVGYRKLTVQAAGIVAVIRKVE